MMRTFGLTATARGISSRGSTPKEDNVRTYTGAIEALY